MWNCYYSLSFDFMASRSLEKLEAKCPQYIVSMKEVKHTEAALLTGQIWRLFLGLINTSAISTSPSSTSAVTTAVTHSESYQSLVTEMASDYPTSPIAPLFARVTDNLLYCYLRHYEMGANLYLQRKNEFLRNLPNQSMGVWDMYASGVCLYATAKRTGQRRYLRYARQVRKTMEKWWRQGNPNVRHHTALLLAEEYTIRRQFDKARQSYESAILAASRGGFIHDAALANERYALCLFHDLKDIDGGQFYLGEANRLYREWGAHAVADGLEHIQTTVME
jgi:hypothetical protein